MIITNAAEQREKEKLSIEALYRKRDGEMQTHQESRRNASPSTH